MRINLSIDIDNPEYTKLIYLGLGGFTEVLSYPELCSIKSIIWDDENLRDYNRNNSNWYASATVVHALALKGYSEILNYPQYLKIKNGNGETPLHLLLESYLPELWYDLPNITPEIKNSLDKILQIDNLGDLKDIEGNTPLHYIGKLGYVPLLDYPEIEKMESPEYNTHGTPLNHLYKRAQGDLDKLLKHPSLFIRYKTHQEPFYDLANNITLRPTVKTLKKYGFRFNKKWHPSKKLDYNLVNDILSTPKSIQFMIY